MFIIKPVFPNEWQLALFQLSYYDVRIEMYSDRENPYSTYLKVTEGSSDDLYLAEMAFMMNWRQGNNLCPDCSTHRSHEGNCCGHLTFTSVIDSTEFDRLFDQEG